MRRTLSVLSLCILAGIGAPAFMPGNAQAQGKSTSASQAADQAISVEEAKNGTYIRLKGAGEPTFSVFKLTNPLRLFVDVSGWEEAGQESQVATRTINNGVISKVALMPLEESERPVTRLIIGFDQSAHYDVKADGHDLIVFVDGAKRDQTPAQLAQVEKRAEQLEAEREAAVARARTLEAELSAARKTLDEVVGEKDQVKARLAKMARQADSSRHEVDRQIDALDGAEKRQAELKAQIADLRAELKDGNESARAELTQLETTRDKLNQQLDSQRKDLQQARQAADSANQRLSDMQSRVGEREAEIARLKNELDKTRARQAQEQKAQQLVAQRNAEQKAQERAQKSEQAQREAQKNAQKAQEALARAQKESAREMENLKKLRGDLQNEQGRIAQLESKRQAEESELARLADQRERTKSALSQAEAELAERRKELSELREREDLPAARAVAVNPQEHNQVRDIRLETRDGRSRIIVELNQPSSFETLSPADSRAVMILNGVTLPEDLERTLSSGAQGGAVRFLSSYTDPEGKVRVEAELGGETSEIVRQDGNQVVWEFAPFMAKSSQAKADAADSNSPNQLVSHNASGASGKNAPRPASQGKSFTSAPPNYRRTVTDPSKASSVPGMSKKRLTIDLRSADIQNVLRLLAKEGGVNIIAGDDVKGTVTMRLRSVPLDQVFLTVLNSQSLGFETRGNVIRVAPQKTLLAEQQARAEAAASQQKLEPLEVFLMPVNYAEAGEMQSQVQGLLSPRGSVTVDSRTNTLIIKDLAENLVPIRALVENLDSQVPQVLIEARIVETNDTFTRELGIQWGGDFSFSQGNGNPTGLIFPGVLGVAGGATDNTAPVEGTSTNPNFAVNLPAPAGTGSGGAIGLTMGSVGGAVNLNLRLSAMEASGHAKIVSAPRIMTLDNKEATISQGTSIPISVVSAAGVQTVFVDATLQLQVKPHVTPDGNIQLKISATKNEPDFQNVGARGDPTIISKQAETELLIKDGDTTVIGGIYTRNSGSSLAAVPFLHKIPILGGLFRSASTSERRTELLIFITPRIVNRQESLGSHRENASLSSNN